MSRWRPPAETGKPYITAAGYRALEAEVKSLWTRRQDVVRHLAAAAAEGDRSENAEYIYRKKELREIDRRLGYLQRRLPRLTVVHAAPDDRERVFFGAKVELEDDAGEALCYRIVGSDEARAEQGDISIDSPMARQLLGRRVGDEVVLSGKQAGARCAIVAIVYANASEAP